MTDEQIRDLAAQWRDAPADARGPIRKAIEGGLREPDSGPAPDPLGEALAALDPADPDPAATLRAALAPQPFDLEPADASDAPPPRREWLLPGWLPRGRLAAVYGRGEAGKSRLMLQMAHAVVHGGPVLTWDPDVTSANADAVRGDVPEAAGRGRVLIVTWEDEVDEMRRRWRMAHAAAAVEYERIPAEISILDMRRHGAGPLWAPNAEGSGHVSTRGEWTPAGRRFLAMLPSYDLAVLDPLASAYACSEIDRALVRAFAARLDSQAEAAGCAVMLSAHPSRTGEREGSAEAGSTDWRNAVRSRWVLGPQPTGHKAAKQSGKDASIRLPGAGLIFSSGNGRKWTEPPGKLLHDEVVPAQICRHRGVGLCGCEGVGNEGHEGRLAGRRTCAEHVAVESAHGRLAVPLSPRQLVSASSAATVGPGGSLAGRWVWRLPRRIPVPHGGARPRGSRRWRRRQ